MTRAVLLLMFASAIAWGQNADHAKTPAIAMPADRAADSYRIYSTLIPLGETAGKGWPHDLWLVQDTTMTAVLPDEPCYPDTASNRLGTMNPHTAVHPTEDRRQDFVEILQDFDAHCHDRISLNADAFFGIVPLRLLNPAEQDKFQKSRFEGLPAPEFKGAPALYAFSEVYFNAKHTVALVYATHWCGGLCGEGFWVAFGLEDGKWKRLAWNSAGWISHLAPPASYPLPSASPLAPRP